MQKVLEETQLDMNEFDNLLQPIIDTCTKDAISVSKHLNLSVRSVFAFGGDSLSLVMSAEAGSVRRLF